MPINLVVPGEPRGKGRPRFVRATGRTYTPAETEQAEGDVLTVWMAAGRPRIDGPVCLTVELVLSRPKAHWRADGTLGLAGQRAWWPTRKPDLDNAWKLLADALSGRAFGDDAQVVYTLAWKRWARPGEAPHARVAVVAAPLYFEAGSSEGVAA